MATIKKILLIVAFSLFATMGNAAENAPLQVAEQLQERYDSMKSLSFTFHQRTSGEMTGRPKQGSGQALFLRNDKNGKMRWDYSAPDTQVLLSDGKTFSMYFEKLQQMIITPASAMQKDLTYSFFTGSGNLVNDFEISEADSEYNNADDQLQTIKLIPKQAQSQVQDIHLWVSVDFLIRRINIKDHFGTITSLNLSDIKMDSLEAKEPAAIDELFSFTPPEGTEIIKQF